MYLNLIERNIRLEDIVITETVHMRNFAIAALDWYAIPIYTRNEIAKALIGITPEFDDDYFYCALIVPKKNDVLNIGNIMIYANEYEPDDGVFIEIEKYIDGGDTYLWGNLTILSANIYEQTEVCSLFLPSINMCIK